MPKYCLDTSGFSHPLETLPDDIHVTMWEKVKAVIRAGEICFNFEICQELEAINGPVGECLKECAESCKREVGDNSWDWQAYLQNFEMLKNKYKDVISEYHGNRKGTAGLNDISIVALAVTLKLPLISMEALSGQQSLTKKRIPEICQLEGVKHMTFNEFLRAEKILV
jgi:Domain of unknown function (DUF4411)